MYVKRHVVNVTTDASGNATAYTDVPVAGYVLAIRYLKDGGSNPLANTAVATITAETSGEAIVTTPALSASITFSPRQPTHAVADGSAALYAAAGTAVNDRIPVAQERIQIAIASGGNTKVGAFHIYVEGGTN
jgi:hypothetical protein